MLIKVAQLDPKLQTNASAHVRISVAVFDYRARRLTDSARRLHTRTNRKMCNFSVLIFHVELYRRITEAEWHAQTLHTHAHGSPIWR
jgi:hypothetical protein